MKYASLFSGIGGFDLGFDRAGMECVLQVEQDNSCLGILARHWPKVKKVNDVRKIKRVSADLICGGFPCQDVSVAGKRAGLDGERSGLWFEFHRIIERNIPRWVVVENVPGLLSSNDGRDFAAILRGLVECGYGVAWRILDAQYFGLAQRRRRVFIVASLGNGRAAQVLFERNGCAGDTPPSREARERVAAKIESGANATGGTRPPGTAVDTADTLIVARGQSARNTRIDATAETFIVNAFNGYTGGPDDNDAQGGHQVAAPIVFDWQSCGDVRLNVSDKHTSALQANQTPAIAFAQNTRDEVRLIGGDGSHAGALTAQPGMKQQTFIAFTERTRKEGRTFEAQEEIAYALTNPGSGGRTHSRQIAGAFGVRRLMPVEFERLQGFPVGWTDGQSDSVRYRQLGNAIAVPCAEWIGRRIMETDK